MRKPSPLRFEAHTTQGDLRTLSQYLSSSSSTYCSIPAPQIRYIETQTRQLLEACYPPEETFTVEISGRACGRKRKVVIPLLSYEVQWTTLFATLLHLPIEDTISVKRHIAELFAEEFAVFWEDCLGIKMAIYAVDMDIAGLGTNDIKERIRELAQPATQTLIEETRAKVRKEEEKKIDAKIIPMCRRVKAFRKEKGIWNTWRSGPHKKYHDIPEENESPLDESPFWYGPDDGDGIPPRYPVVEPVARRVARRRVRRKK